MIPLDKNGNIHKDSFQHCHEIINIDFRIHHFDWYRLPVVTRKDMEMLEISSQLEKDICLMEWPERMDSSVLPTTALEIHIEMKEDEEDACRILSCHIHGNAKRWLDRIHLFKKYHQEMT